MFLAIMNKAAMSVHSCSGLYVNITSHFSGINVQECNCGVKL